MVKKILIVIVLLAGIGAGVWYGYQHLEEEVTPPSTIIRAIPMDAALIVESNSAPKVWNKLSETNVMWEELKITESFAELDSMGTIWDSLYRTNETLRNIANENGLVISAHMSGANDFDFLLVMAFPSRYTSKSVETMFTELTNAKATFQERNYDETVITEVSTGADQRKFSYTVKDGMLIWSYSSVLIESAIRHLNSDADLNLNTGFAKVQRTADKTLADANIYVNYETFPNIVATYLNTETKLQAMPLQSLANWTEVDLNVLPNGLSMSGFTYSNDTINQYLNIFHRQKPQDIEIPTIAPDNTAYMMYSGFSDFPSFYEDYRSYLERNNKLFEYDRDLDATNETCGCDLKEGINGWIGNEMAIVITEPSGDDLAPHTFAIFGTNNIDNAETKLELLLTQIALKYSSTADLEVYRDHVIKQLRIGKGLSKLLGSSFKNLNDPYYTIIDDYVVMGNSRNAIRDMINTKLDDKTLYRDPNYRIFTEEIASEANVYIYSNIARSPNLYQKVLNPDYAADVEQHIELYRKFEGAAIQLSAYKDQLFLNNIYLKYNPVYKQTTSALWETQLDTTVSSAPVFMKNHTNNTLDVFIQDERNNIHLIGSNGTPHWSRNVDGPIMGKVHQIDAYNNDKLQFLFNTRNKLYLVDRLGRDVPGWPVALKAPASNGVTVMDYDNNKNYRLLIACMDNQVYNYNRDGQLVEGWQFAGSSSRVKSEIHHFVVANKDYICITDIAGKIYLVDRRGQQRFESLATVTGKSNNKHTIEKGSTIENSKIVYTDTLGNIVKLQFDGNLERINLGSFNKEHHFHYVDLDNDGKKEYILLDDMHLMVFNGDRELRFDFAFENTIEYAPTILKGANGAMYIGVTSALSQEVFLFNSQGSIVEGLPLFGSTLMDLGDMNLDGGINLVTAGSDGNVYTYTLNQ